MSSVSTPTKLRTSPRKRAWASPAKKAKAAVSDLFNAELNGSWAEVTESDSSLCDFPLPQQEEQMTRSEPRRRKPAEPRKTATTKPKFVRSLELSEAIAGKRSDRAQRAAKRDAEGDKEGPERTMTRKRHLSNSSQLTTDTSSEYGASPAKKTPGKHAPSVSNHPAKKMGRPEGKSPARNRLFAAKSSSSPATKEFNPKDYWEDPTLGWCQDEAVIEKRGKEIEKAKEKPVYAKYLAAIPKHKRERTLHPRTPNKLINFSRRSWDSQVRSWKRSLYQWAGEEPSESTNTSYCSEKDTEERRREMSSMEADENEKPLQAVREVEIPMELKVRPETDAMASLLGKFDMDTRTGDESTLKAPATGQMVGGPVDFSSGIH